MIGSATLRQMIRSKVCGLDGHVFFMKDSDLKAPFPSPPPFGVDAVFAEGERRRVDPMSLSTIHHDKLIHKFDLNAETPIFEHAPTVAQQRFVVPEGQFGSKPQGVRDESHLAPEFKGKSGEPMASHGGQAPLHDAAGLHQRDTPIDGARDEAPCPRDHAPRGGDDGSRGASNSNGDYLHSPYTWDDSSGEDHQDPTSGISCSNGSVPTRSRACKEDREQARTIPGMHSMRVGEEGLGRELRGPDHQRADPDLCTSPRNSKSSRRNRDGCHAKHSSLFGKLGQVLFAIVATQLGTSFQNFDKEDFWNNNYEESGRSVESSTLFPRISDLGRSGHGGRGHGGPGNMNGVLPQDESLFGDGPNILKSGMRKRLKHHA